MTPTCGNTCRLIALRVSAAADGLAQNAVPQAPVSRAIPKLFNPLYRVRNMEFDGTSDEDRGRPVYRAQYQVLDAIATKQQ